MILKRAIYSLLRAAIITPLFAANADDYNSNLERLVAMFDQMVVNKDVTKIPQFYHPDFMLYSNGETQNYAELIEFHEKVYATDIQYSFRIDKDTVVEQKDKVSTRMFITISKPEQEDSEIELILIAQYKDNLIHRAWELTFPNWVDDKKLKTE